MQGAKVGIAQPIPAQELVLDALLHRAGLDQRARSRDAVVADLAVSVSHKKVWVVNAAVCDSSTIIPLLPHA